MFDVLGSEGAKFFVFLTLTAVFFSSFMFVLCSPALPFGRAFPVRNWWFAGL